MWVSKHGDLTNKTKEISIKKSEFRKSKWGPLGRLLLLTQYWELNTPMGDYNTHG